MTRSKRTYQVVIFTFLGTERDRPNKETCVLATGESEALQRATRKLFGRGTFWWPDSGAPGLGQVMRTIPGENGATSVTSRVRADVYPRSSIVWPSEGP